MVALTLNLVSVQPCAGRENRKREIVEIIIFREIKVPGNILVIQYVALSAVPTIGMFCIVAGTTRWYGHSLVIAIHGSGR